MEELLKTLIQKIDRLTDMVADMQRDINDIKRHGRDTVSDMVATRSTKTTNAERCRKYREKRKAAASGPTHVATYVAPKAASTLTSSIDSKISQEERFESVAPARAREARKTALALDWVPQLGFGEHAEFAKFRDSALAHGRKYVNWEAAWSTWKRRIPDFNRSGSNGRRHGSVLDACDRLKAELNAQGSFAENYVPGSSGPRPLRLDQGVRPADLKLLPPR